MRRDTRPKVSATGTGRLSRRALTLLLPRPEPVVVEPDASGAPATVLVGGRPLRIACVRGPARLETGWWRGPDVRRDYYEATLADGRCAWLFRDLASDAWRLHGWLT